MPAPCSLLLEVYAPLSIYDESLPTVDWEVSTDPAHPFPFLIGPQNYAAQEIDSIGCTATIGTVDVGVIDVPIVAGDQTTGWATSKIHDVLGRRCRLRRWINDDVGWVTIADGPAGPPTMDASYAAYRWPIRDTREAERKLAAFQVGGVASIVPRGAIYGFGQYTNDSGDHLLLDRTLDNAIFGIYELSTVGPNVMGLINFAGHFSGPAVDDDRMILMDNEAVDAIQMSEISSNFVACRNADVLWRVFELDTPWNISRPAMPITFPQPFVGTVDVNVDGKLIPAMNYITLFVAPTVPHGFPTETGTIIGAILRYRGIASEAFPYYVEGALGDVLSDLYQGKYTLPRTDEIEGVIYDPGGLDAISAGFLPRILFDPTAMEDLIEHVMLRQEAPIADVRAWTETALYAPSGWIPAFDAEKFISPVSRTPPDTVVLAMTLEDEVVSPSPAWTTGENTISEITYTYNRFYRPIDATTKIKMDGLAVREVDLTFEDAESDLRYATQAQDYDATAFSAVGTNRGITIPGQLEQASLLCQQAKFDVLDRYRQGVQSISLDVRRDRVPALRVGDWVPWSLSYMPNRITGLRGSVAELAQVVAVRDNDCTWRSIIVEESKKSDGPPGLVTSLIKTDDEPSAGGVGLVVLSDVESY